MIIWATRIPKTFGSRVSSGISTGLLDQSRGSLICSAHSEFLTEKLNFRRQPSYSQQYIARRHASTWYQSIAQSTPVVFTQDCLQNFHDLSGLPWWASIIVSTVAIRTSVTFPLALYQHYIMAKLENLKPEMDGLVKELKRETAIAIKRFNWTEKEAKLTYNRSAKKMWNNLIIRDNCHPFKASLLIWIQVPLWVCMTYAHRNLATMQPFQDAQAELAFMELSVGGFGWIPNLTVVDHAWVLPILLGLSNLLIIELHGLLRDREKSKLQKVMTNVFRGVSVLMVPVAAFAPANVSLYWTVSSIYGLLQNLVLLSPAVRRTARIPLAPSELPRPYSLLVQKIKSKLSVTLSR